MTQVLLLDCKGFADVEIVLGAMEEMVGVTTTKIKLFLMKVLIAMDYRIQTQI